MKHFFPPYKLLDQVRSERFHSCTSNNLLVVLFCIRVQSSIFLTICHWARFCKHLGLQLIKWNNKNCWVRWYWMPLVQFHGGFHSIFSFSFTTQHWFFNKWEHSNVLCSTLLPLHVWTIYKKKNEFSLILWRPHETKVPCTSVAVISVLLNSHPFVHLSKAFSNRQYWEKKVFKSPDWKTSLCSVMVTPQMKNCVQFINSLKLSGESIQFGNGVEILTHKKKR